MKKSKPVNRKTHKRALKAANRRKAFAKQKHLWDQGIGLYDTEPEKERNKSD